MKIAIRVDSSTEMGLGHIYRCLALAGVLQARGTNVLFLCRKHPGERSDLIEAQGFAVRRLPPPTQADFTPQNVYQAWLGVSEETDAQQTAAMLTGDGVVDWMVVDHYGLGRSWQELLRPRVTRLMVVDDLANRPHCCDLLLDQTPGRHCTDYQSLVVAPKPLLLCGANYALLREEFAQQHQTSRRVRFTPPYHLAISMGGTDPADISSRVLSMLASVPRASINSIVLLLNRTPTKSLLEAVASAPHKVELVLNCKQVATIYRDADLVIGAAGVSALERCAVGTPSLQYIYAENQNSIAAYLERAGAALTFGSHADMRIEKLATQMALLFEQPHLLSDMSLRASNVCDAKGCERVADALFGLPSLQIRAVDLTDCEELYHWQTITSVRRYFRNPQPPKREEHDRWFAQTMNSTNRQLYLIIASQQRVGLVRFDKADNRGWEISILVTPQFQGCGYAQFALRWAKRQTHFQPLLAEVHVDNHASQRLFERAGFRRLDLTHFQFNPATEQP